MNNNYHLAIIGSGSGGREAALLAGRKGLRTALIERDGLGVPVSIAALTLFARCKLARAIFATVGEAIWQ